MTEKFKVGDKGRHVTIPDGWHRITEGKAQRGDYFADVNTGNWRPCTDRFEVGDDASGFELLIRSYRQDAKPPLK